MNRKSLDLVAWSSHTLDGLGWARAQFDYTILTMGFWLGTLVFFLIQVVVTGGVNIFSQSGNKGLNHIMGLTCVFQLWLLWAIVYIAQMNPMIMPQFNE